MCRAAPEGGRRCPCTQGPRRRAYRRALYAARRAGTTQTGVLLTTVIRRDDPEPAATEAATATPASAQPVPVSFAELGRDERLEAMRAEIDTALDSMARPEEWTRFLASAASFHRYSWTNALLVQLQHPGATQVAGFRDWKNKHDRPVRKGEKAIWIWAPMTRKVLEEDTKTGEERTRSQVIGFRPVPVFDVSQTEGPPLPAAPVSLAGDLDGGAPTGMRSALETRAGELGFAVDYAPPTGGEDGYTDFAAKRIQISPGSARHQALTLAHEVAHVSLGHGDRRGEYHTGTAGRRSEMEIEAESTAYVVARSWGLDDAGRSSFGYIEHWARGDRDKVRGLADKVIKAARSIVGDQQREAAT